MPCRWICCYDIDKQSRIYQVCGVIVRISKRKKMETALFYARAACDTMMRKFAAADLPPKGHFYYHQGVFLSGVLKTWQLTGDVP